MHILPLNYNIVYLIEKKLYFINSSKVQFYKIIKFTINHVKLIKVSLTLIFIIFKLKNISVKIYQNKL